MTFMKSNRAGHSRHPGIVCCTRPEVVIFLLARHFETGIEYSFGLDNNSSAECVGVFHGRAEPWDDQILLWKDTGSVLV